MKKRSSLYSCGVLSAVFAICLVIGSCGKEFYFAGRTLPPSGVLNRVLIAEQNPSAFSSGALPFVDAFYDIRHAYNASSGQFSIAGFSGKLPLTIQNMPEQQAGAVYSPGDGSLALISYAQEKVNSSVTIPGGLSSTTQPGPYNGVAISRDLGFVYAANPSNHVISVVSQTGNNPLSLTLNLPNAYGVSVNPGGTVALVFVHNAVQTSGHKVAVDDPATFAVYSIVQLTAAQQLAAVNNPNYLGAQDCEPQKQPFWCVFPVTTGASASFDHPIKAVFSPDGTTAYVLNCGPECGGGTTPGLPTTASLTTIPITAASLNSGATGASGIALVAQSTIPIPGGATDAVFNGSTLYVAGQQYQASSGLFGGYLTVLNTPSNAITGNFPISDGVHTRMVFADNNTLWIGSSACNQGVRYSQAQAGANLEFGCITMFNTANNNVYIGAYQGDGTGIAAVTGLGKVYTTEGGQVYIYSTTPGSSGLVQLDNTNVTIAGTAIDCAYMDGVSDANNTIY
ncbi:MAG TPA: hypothetical protein VHX37_01100 [Acidobacteriaceae bacterium]|nr:hypothetical protein [Acidobacteriaceae bacterium]